MKLEAMKELIRRGADLEVLGIDFMSTLHETPVNVEAANQILDQKFKLKREKARYLVESFAGLKGVLTAEQHQKVKALWKQKG